MNKSVIFVINFLTGLIFLGIFGFLLLSFVSFSQNDPAYSFSIEDNNLLTYNNLAGFYGAYISGLFFDLLGLVAYLVLPFFLIIGVKKSLFKKVSFIYVRFFFFLFSLTIFCFLYFELINNKIKIGEIISSVFIVDFVFLINNTLLIYILYLLLFLISTPLYLFGVSIKLRFINKLFLILYRIIWMMIKGIFIFTKKNSSSGKEKLYKQKQIISDSEQVKKMKTEPTFISKSLSAYKRKSVVLESNSKSSVSGEYTLPPVSLLSISKENKPFVKEIEKRNIENAKKLEQVLSDFNITGTIENIRTGPIVTLFEFQPSAGIKSSKIINLADDIARSMSSVSARVSSQPGKNSIGIEIPNIKKQDVLLGDLVNDLLFANFNRGLILALGKNISGDKIFTDLEKMPHLLIAGTTGSGKSVGINSMIMSLLFKFKPSECKFILIDPKMLELNIYENIPHLLSPVVTDPKKAISALKWVVKEMEDRYKLMSSAGVKNIKSFNLKIEECLAKGKKLYREVQTGIDESTRLPIIEKKEILLEPMPLIVVVIDEMADLMMVAGKEVEHSIQRLAQMARASGIHLIAATQRPSVDVITGTIKANFPSRISYRVASKFDSRTIINEMGAEQLLGSGDMLFLENGANLLRLHGGFVSEKEIENVVNFINSQSTNEIQKDISADIDYGMSNEFSFESDIANSDELYNKAVKIVLDTQKASTSFIQRHLQIGYNRAARIIEQMEKEGIISEANHVGKRSVLKKSV
ncbi:MAG: DNA translocase FtsK [Alphaproteobacteria bacterium MarineAlpha5_Bin9]|nr:MAG: DNA translocase FtsK [Alphaproteobacteria bacterium MarineAlpha5_Bin9]|tara:strand:+ start:9073 stop:11328 length:2256 start_codon:yes stop_codon:yes gene_type:complete